MNERVQEILKGLSNEQKARLLYGKDFWYIDGEALGKIMLTDGPAGLRKQQGKADMAGINESLPATAYPAGCAAACSWDVSLMLRLGEALGRECKKEGVAVLLGPAVNHKRDPLCGRNFEYFSEDPLLSGKLGAAYVKGLQGVGVGACVKHFACNSRENGRMISDSLVDERALREIYLRQFEIIVKEARPWAVMTAYNKLNGTYCSQNGRLMTEIARGEWGFDGLFLSDWGAMRDQAESYEAGLDLEMPGICGGEEEILAALREGGMTEETLNARAGKVIELLLKAREGEKINALFNREESLSLAQEIAEASAVLLKNEGVLPYDKENKEKIAVIGAFAEKPYYQGGGSGHVIPAEEVSFLAALKERGVRYDYAPGFTQDGRGADEKLIAEAVAVASVRERAVIFAGSYEGTESEGYDRTSLDLPPEQTELIERVAAVNQNVVVVLTCGAPVSMPWLKSVKGVLLTYFSGCLGGRACAALLFGDRNPSGKLAETFPLCYKDVPSAFDFGKNEEYAEYRESIYTGYRWYDAAEKEVLFPFGFGLSYTSFEYGKIELSSNRYRGEGVLTVRVPVKNTGTCAGAEIVQIYVGQRAPKICRPIRELRAFEKVCLQAGEEKAVSFTLGWEAFAHYSPQRREWCIEGGEYTIYAASSSRDVRAEAIVFADGGEDAETMSAPAFPAPGSALSRERFLALSGVKIPEPRQILPITLHSPLEDLQKSRGGRLLYKLIVKFAGAGKDRHTANMQRKVIAQMPVLGLTMGIRLSRKGAEGFVQIANGHRLKGIKTILRDLKKHRKKKK